MLQGFPQILHVHLVLMLQGFPLILHGDLVFMLQVDPSIYIYVSFCKDSRFYMNIHVSFLQGFLLFGNLGYYPSWS